MIVNRGYTDRQNVYSPTPEQLQDMLFPKGRRPPPRIVWRSDNRKWEIELYQGHLLLFERKGDDWRQITSNYDQLPRYVHTAYAEWLTKARSITP